MPSDLTDINTQIMELSLIIEKLKHQRCDLIADSENADVQDLIDYIGALGLGVRDVISLLEGT